MRRDRSRKPRRKVCNFCVDHVDQIDYKDIAKLRRFIKRARAIALLPFTAE